MGTRSEEIHGKGFNLFSNNIFIQPDNPDSPLAYRNIKVGAKTLSDATVNLGSYAKIPNYGGVSKGMVYQALATKNLQELRRISNLFYNINGMYQRVCDYFAFLYRFDWYVCVETLDNSFSESKVCKEFYKCLNYLDKSYLKKLFGDISLEIIKNGCYYGYLIENANGFVLQQLPPQYCRSRYKVGTTPVVEFNMQFFDTFSSTAYREKILKLFPEEFQKGYRLYRQAKLQDDIMPGTANILSSGWYLLDPEYAVKFNFKDSDVPIFVSSIPAMIDLDAAQDLDRKKQMQKLLKILIQKLPLDKNGDLIFDVDEARDMHNSAVEMLSNSIGVDILTTFTDVMSIDLSDKNTTATQDDLAKVERTVYNSLGISRNLFNTDSNMSLEKSILNDESTVRNLLLQYQAFMDKIVAKRNSSKKCNFRFIFLETTQYNYQNLAKLYKEHTQLGFSKILPQIALGQSQSFILNSIYFENEVLHLSEIMIPPLMSSTLSSEDILARKDARTSDNSHNNAESAAANLDKKEVGRPQKEESEKSDKTMKNLESQ